MSKNKKFNLMRVTFSAFLLAGTTACSKLLPEDPYKGLHGLMYEGLDGPILADVENPIGIVVKNATETEQLKIKSVIDQMNGFCPNLDFTFTDKNNISIENKIFVETNYQFKDEGGLTFQTGKVTIRADKFGCKIKYPVYLYINTELIDLFEKQWKKDDIYTHVLKHELMHTLGFCDQADIWFKDKTIMYKETTYDGLFDFTQMDINNINRLYGADSVIVKHPKKLDVEYYKKEEELEM